MGVTETQLNRICVCEIHRVDTRVKGLTAKYYSVLRRTTFNIYTCMNISLKIDIDIIQERLYKVNTSLFHWKNTLFDHDYMFRPVLRSSSGLIVDK